MGLIMQLIYQQQSPIFSILYFSCETLENDARADELLMKKRLSDAWIAVRRFARTLIRAQASPATVPSTV